jgi:hypothetical protein
MFGSRHDSAQADAIRGEHDVHRQHRSGVGIDGKVSIDATSYA